MLLTTSHPLPLTRAGFATPEPIPIDAHARLKGGRAPDAAYAGLLLRLGHWDLSHDASSAIDSLDGAYWHAIVHRMEPDFANAAYWYRRVGDHPIFPALWNHTKEQLAAASIPSWQLGARWDPFLFLRWMSEAAASSAPEKESLGRSLAETEWDLLFSWCASAASSAS